MAIEKVILIKVQDGEVEQATKEVQSLGHSIERVEGQSKKSASSLSSGFDDASSAASNLSGGLEGVADQVITVGKAAKTSGQAMKAALSATFIGAAVVILGEIIQNWDKIFNTAAKVTAEIEKQVDLLNTKKDVLDSEIDLIDSQLKLLKGKDGQSEAIQDLIDRQKELNKEKLNTLATEIELLKQLKLQTLEEAQRATVGGFFRAVATRGNRGRNRGREVDTEEQIEINKIQTSINEAQEAYNKLQASILGLDKKTSGGKAKETKYRESPL